jgi:hypothetical protein
MDFTLKLHQHVAHMGWHTVEAIAAVEGINMIAYGLPGDNYPERSASITLSGWRAGGGRA